MKRSRLLAVFPVAVVFLLCLLNLLPPLFARSLYFDNVCNVILYLMLTYLGIMIPFVFHRMNKMIASMSSLIGAWYFAGLIFEVVNFHIPEIVLNSLESDFLYVKFLIAFSVGIAFIITSNTWNKQKK